MSGESSNLTSDAAGPDRAELRIGDTLSHFRIKARLGRGAMGVVVLAEDTILHREVALKILKRRDDNEKARIFIEQFLREARAAAKLVHPHIVQVFEISQIGGDHFIAMEYVGGDNLHELVKSSGPLDVPTACRYASEIAQAMAFAHERGVIHRDLKPANILLSDSGHIKVADFGLATLTDPNDDFEYPWKAVGSPYYMAPELARGQASPQSDIFALGGILWFLLTGKPPFALKVAKDFRRVHTDIPLPPLRSLCIDAPLQLSDLCEKALAREPGDRFVAAAEMAKQLDAIVRTPAAPPTIAPPPSTTAVPSPHSRRVPVAAIVGIAAVVLILLGVLAVSLSSQKPSPPETTTAAMPPLAIEPQVIEAPPAVVQSPNSELPSPVTGIKLTNPLPERPPAAEPPPPLLHEAVAESPPQVALDHVPVGPSLEAPVSPPPDPLAWIDDLPRIDPHWFAEEWCTLEDDAGVQELKQWIATRKGQATVIGGRLLSAVPTGDIWRIELIQGYCAGGEKAKAIVIVESDRVTMAQVWRRLALTGWPAKLYNPLLLVRGVPAIVEGTDRPTIRVTIGEVADIARLPAQDQTITLADADLLEGCARTRSLVRVAMHLAGISSDSSHGVMRLADPRLGVVAMGDLSSIDLGHEKLIGQPVSMLTRITPGSVPHQPELVRTGSALMRLRKADAAEAALLSLPLPVLPAVLAYTAAPPVEPHSVAPAQPSLPLDMTAIDRLPGLSSVIKRQEWFDFSLKSSNSCAELRRILMTEGPTPCVVVMGIETAEVDASGSWTLTGKSNDGSYLVSVTSNTVRADELRYRLGVSSYAEATRLSAVIYGRVELLDAASNRMQLRLERVGDIFPLDYRRADFLSPTDYDRVLAFFRVGRSTSIRGRVSSVRKLSGGNIFVICNGLDEATGATLLIQPRAWQELLTKSDGKLKGRPEDLLGWVIWYSGEATYSGQTDRVVIVADSAGDIGLVGQGDVEGVPGREVIGKVGDNTAAPKDINDMGIAIDDAESMKRIVGASDGASVRLHGIVSATRLIDGGDVAIQFEGAQAFLARIPARHAVEFVAAYGPTAVNLRGKTVIIVGKITAAANGRTQQMEVAQTDQLRVVGSR